jgi:hypothetical protein
MAISSYIPLLRVKYLEYHSMWNFGTLTNQGEIGMSQQQKLEKVLDLLLSEDSDQAAELLHQIIVEKARVIYESIVEEEDTVVTEGEDEVGGEPNKDFTDEIASDKDEVDSDEQNDGEAGGGEDDGEGSDDEDEEGAADEFGGDAGGEGTTEERVEDLESQLAELRAEFDALMGEEMQEPQHADMGADMGAEVAPADDGMGGAPDFGGGMGGEDKVVGEVVATMFEKKKDKKLEVAPQKKDEKKDKKVDEETQFLSKVGDTGQKGTAKLVGTGKNTPLGAEQTKSSFTNIPPRKDYGGKPTNILGSKSTGGEYGKYNGDSAKDDTPSDNVKVDPKKSGVKADTTAKWTGGKASGEGFTKSPLTKKPA